MDLTAFLPFLFLLLFIPIFLSGRRQRKQMEETQKMQSELADGDVVVTTSGLRATVVDASYEDTLDLEIAPGVVTTWVRASIREKVRPDADSADESTPDTEASGPTEAPATDSTGGRPTS